MNNEIEWRAIPSFPNYEASNTGLIRRAKTGDVLKQRDIDMNRPYQIVSIFYNKKKYTKKVSRLIWEAFNDCACGMTIDHIDRNKTNNIVWLMPFWIHPIIFSLSFQKQREFLK